MKIFPAFFAACMLLACAASCSSSSAVSGQEVLPSGTSAQNSEHSAAEAQSGAVPADTPAAVTTEAGVQQDTSASPAETAAPAQDSGNVTTDAPPQVPEADITGKWLVSTSDGMGLGLGFSGGEGSVFVDFSGQMYFSGGKFIAGGRTVSEVSYDGSNLSVTANGSDLMTLKRTGSADPDSINGLYTLVSGTLYDQLAVTIGEQLGVSGSDADITFGIDGETFYMCFNDMFSYTVSGNMLAMKGNVTLLGDSAANGSYAEFEINGSSMSFLTNSGELISLTRWG